jgi:hypothetical protein
MKRFILLFIFFLNCSILSAQDIITMKDGTDIQAKVLEVAPSLVSYKKFSNLEGPTYTVSKLEILMITYENGERELYNVDKNSLLPQGMMTYNSWSGKVSIGGVTMEREMLGRYFSPEDYKLFNKGKRLSTIGCIIGIIGSIPVGWEVGEMIVGESPNPWVLVGGGTAFLGGLLLNGAGNGKIRMSVSNYNSTLGFQTAVQFGFTPNGIGFALVF